MKPSWRGLERLTCEGTDPHRPDAAELAARTAAWRAAFVAAGWKRVGVHAADAAELAALLLGAWGAGCEVVLPGDDSPDTAAALRRRVDGLAGTLVGGMPAPAPAPAAPPVDFPALPLTVFTSGSSGDPLACPKRLSDLENELRGLEAAFGAELEGATVAGTVGHQHIYGLLFRVLWPLCAGRPSRPELLRYPEELEALAAKQRLALVSSPAFLKRLPPAPLAARPAVVFSSGGPLDFAAALDCVRVLGCEPLEVYGSSETGGVAWRRRRAERQAWIPFEGVSFRVTAQGLLELRSDRMAEGKEWFTTADRAEPVGEGFVLLGRADRVAKVEEKRVSLEALERALEADPGVRQARLVLLKGRRDELGAVLVSADGSIPTGADKLARVKALKARLRAGFEAVVLPRRWRFVAALPQNELGKVTQAALARLFEPPTQPEWLGEERREGGVLRLHLRLPPDLVYFEGHFPGAPVLAGVVQLDWAVEEGRRRLGLVGRFVGLRALKFSKPLLPGDVAVLELCAEADGLRFSYESAAGRHSSGKVLFAPDDGL